ncbi:hypothetical protein CEXT_564721 [Caerostris extrusa]|uniref:Uncharacterized protein n=1 Tax=Caerostris extrusa TaxID=172846 RepID=A0AAV4WMM9_CAEEX|nr:hypothetical protein CEXT_564721 [Caerostris extrusa]
MLHLPSKVKQYFNKKRRLDSEKLHRKLIDEWKMRINFTVRVSRNICRGIWRGRNDFHGQHKTFTFEHLSDSKYSRNGALGKVFPLWNDAILEFEIPANASSRR